MAKKRKDPAQSATLHDFFQRTDTVPASKKPRLSSITPRRTVKKHHIVPPADIIVIDDSDEDDGPVVDPRTRSVASNDSGARVLSPATSSHNSRKGSLVDAGASDNRAGPSTVSNHRRTSVANWDVLVIDDSDDEEEHLGKKVRLARSPSASARTPLDAAPKDLNDIDSFGQPTLLVDTDDRTVACKQPEDMGFGQPVLLMDPEEARGLEPPAYVPVRDEIACPSPLAATLTHDDSSRPDQEKAEPSPDEWATGDDEMDVAGGESTNDIMGDTYNMVDLQPTVSDEKATETCPICEMVLSGMSYMTMQDHVNGCIDGTAAGSKVTISMLSKPESVSAAKSVPAAKLASSTSTEGKGFPESPTKNDSGVFNVLMTSHKENEAWKEAAVAEDRNFRPTKTNGGRRQAPFYKVMQGMPIAVDAFRYGSIPGVTAYFLTHAHSDHYTNLSANWKHGPIYCSEGTANLIMLMLGVDRKWVHPLSMNVATTIPDTGGVTCTPIEANHCPGSCLFLFEGKQTVHAGDSAYKSPHVGTNRTFRYLHCGDFRASPQHVNHPAIKGKRMDHVYLDTTYLDPKYCFPPQSQVISACAELTRRLLAGESTGDGGAKQDGKVDGWLTKMDKPKLTDVEKQCGKTLVVVGTYSIGKERIVKAIAKALQCKIYSDPRKTAILRCQSDPELDALLTSDPLEAGVHLLPLGTISSDKLKIYLDRWKGQYSKIVGFRPTGWTFSAPSGTETLPAIPSLISRSQAKSFTYANLSPTKNSTSAVQMYGVPYSEHSSFFELTCFALSLEWGRMIATVNVGSETSRAKMSKWVERWEAEKRKRGDVESVPPRCADYW